VANFVLTQRFEPKQAVWVDIFISPLIIGFTKVCLCVDWVSQGWRTQWLGAVDAVFCVARVVKANWMS
jgi:hypothetical protein